MKMKTIRNGTAATAEHPYGIPHGYKLTEVGVIPEEWELKCCWEVSDKITVGIVVRPAQYYTLHGVPAFRSANIRENGINSTDLIFISEQANQQHAKSQVQSGDVLTVRTGYPGTSAVVPPEYSGSNCIDILIIRPSNRIDSNYLAIWINSQFGKNQVLKSQGGLAQQHFNVGALRGLLIARPLLPEQRAIAKALSDTDGLIAALDKLIAKKKAVKQGAMQELLTGKRRLPGFYKKWQDKTLGDIAEIKNGATPSTQNSKYWDGPISWCTPTDITDTTGKYLVKTERNITTAGMDSCAATLLPIGALLLCSRATIGAIKIAAMPVCTNQGFKSLVCKQGVINEFVYYLLLTLKARMIERAIGSTFLEIGKREIASIPVVIPMTEEQHAIASLLSDMDAEIEGLEKRREKMRMIKQGMMQELLTGRTRLVGEEVPA